ncbi:MAG: DUF2304 domain-containing protein [Oscillospiraceae bacterium]
MELIFRISLIIGVLIFLAVILLMMKKHRLSVKYAIVWLVAAFVLLLFAAVPSILIFIRNFLKVEVVSNLVFMIVIAFMLLIILGLSSTVSKFAEEIKKLTQNAAILEKRVRNLENEKNTESKKDI